MLYMKPKKEALSIHERAVNKYNAAYQNMQQLGQHLYEMRTDSVDLICEIESFINSIANKPKEFDKKISDIQSAREKFRETVEYATEAMNCAIKSGLGVAAGVAGGVAAAAIAPTAAMWIATTFGTASTGTAISALHGAAATQAALAWLGGGALSAGGAGIVGGKALLALAGPLGLGIAAGSIAISATSFGYKNKKIAEQAIREAKKITMAGAELNETSLKIQTLADETEMLLDALRETIIATQNIKNANYLQLTEEEQYRLGTMVNNTLTLAELLNKTV